MLPELLYDRVIEVPERVGAHGELIRPLDAGAVERELRAAYADGFRAAAVVCLHGYRYPAHEQRIGGDRTAVGFTQVSESHEVSPLMRLVSRGDTTRGRRLPVAGAAAATSTRWRPSWPGSGCCSCSPTAGWPTRSVVPGQGLDPVRPGRRHRRHGPHRRGGRLRPGDRLRHGRHLDRRLALRGGVRAAVRDRGRRGADARADAVHPHGGGRRRIDPALRRRPVPGRPGLGRRRPRPGLLRPRRPADRDRRQRPARAGCSRITFPRVFGASGDQPLDVGETRRRFAELAARITAATGDRRDPEQVAAGFLEIAVANMANAIKKISVQRGYDVTRYVLSTFGGAGGQHACAVADALGMTSVLIHPLAGVLSAYGIGLADVIAMRESAVEEPLTAETAARLPAAAFRPLEESARADLAAQGAAAPGIRVTRRVHLRYDGTDTPLAVPHGTAEEMTADFERAYRSRFSFLMPGSRIIIEAVSVAAIAPSDPATRPPTRQPPTDPAPAGRPDANATAGPVEHVRMFAAGTWVGGAAVPAP